MHFKLVVPKLIHKEAFLAYIQEWKDEKIVPMSSNMQGMSYEDYLLDNARREHKAYIPQDKVTATTYIMIDDEGVIYGASNLRHELNEYLLNYVGHIGYGIRPSKRGHGYAKPLLRLSLMAAAKKGINRVLVTCDESNIASSKTIIACGGKYENTMKDPEGKLIQRYWISLE